MVNGRSTPLTEKIKSERFRRLSKEGFWIVLGQAMAAVGSLVGVRILTGFLNPAAYGQLALGMTIATLISQTILGPLANGVTRFYAPAVERGDLGGYLKAARRLLIWAIGVIIFIIPFAIVGLLLAGQAKWINIVIGAFFFSVLSGSNSIFTGIQNAARQRSIVAFHQGLQPWMQYLVAAGLLVWLGSTSTIAMIGYALAILLMNGSQYLFFRKVISSRVIGEIKEKEWHEKILNYSWPFATWGVFTWAQLASDRWALGWFSTMQELGLYAVLYQMGYYPISMATGMAVQLLAPIYYQRAGDASDSRRNANVSSFSWRLTVLFLGVTSIAFLAALLFHEQIYEVFVAKQFRTVSFLLPWMMLASGVFAAGQTIALNLMSQMKTHKMMVSKITTSLLGVAFNVAGAYRYGIKGVVFANILFSLVYFLWMVVLSKKDHLNIGREK